MEEGAINQHTLSEEDILHVIKSKLKTTEFELISHEIKQFDEKLGLLGDHATLHVLVQQPSEENPTELSFFIKYFPKEPMQANFAKQGGAFDKEIFTNEVLFNKIKEAGIEIIEQCTVSCYLTEANRVLVFDNLNEEIFKTLHKYEELNYDTILIVLKSLAKLHASSLIYEEKKSEELEKDYRLIEDYRNEFDESFYNDKEGFINKKGVEASIKGILTEIDLFNLSSKLLTGKDFKTVAKECCYKLYDLVKPSDKFRNVICHGDLWSSNFFLKYNEQGKPIQCKFVDFQMTRYAPPSHDVMSVLYLTTSREFRKKHMYELIGLYYTALETNLKLAGYEIKNLIPFQDLLDSCEEQKPFALAQTATYFQLILVETDSLKEFFADPSLSYKALNEDRSVLILSYVHQQETYRRKLEESIQDLRDYCQRI